jgi:hypothetical protein
MNRKAMSWPVPMQLRFYQVHPVCGLLRNKKGHRYIVFVQGPARPTHDTQAVPLSPKAKEHRPLCARGFGKFAGLERNAKNSVQQTIQLSLPGTTGHSCCHSTTHTTGPYVPPLSPLQLDKPFSTDAFHISGPAQISRAAFRRAPRENAAIFLDYTHSPVPNASKKSHNFDPEAEKHRQITDFLGGNQKCKQYKQKSARDYCRRPIGFLQVHWMAG